MSTNTEMTTATADLVIPLGVRDDGTPIRIRQSNAAIFGGTGSGKSALLSQIIEAVTRQGATVLVADAAGAPALHRTVKYALDELDRRAHGGGESAPMLLVLHEVPSWLHGRMQHGDPDTRTAAETTLSCIHRIAAQGRATGVHLLTVGQLAPTSVFGGTWLNNTGTIAVLGRPSEHQLRTVFPASEQDRVRILSSQIGRGERGRGIVLDTHTGAVELFRTHLNDN